MRYALTLLAAMLGLAGCERPPEASRQMDNYLNRVGRVMGQSWQPWDASQLSQYRLPPRRERMLEVPEIRIGLLDLVVESRRCQTLQQLVSERNSSLGRLMPASYLLAYEGDLLRAIQACLLVIADDPARAGLREQLEEIARIKRDNLRSAFWNALNGSAEFEAYLRFSDRPLPATNDPLEDYQAIAALNQLSAIGEALPAELPPGRSSIEPLMHALQRSERSGQLIHTLLRLTHTLNQATAMLEARPANYLCPLGVPTERSRILLNVFRTFYAGDIQPLIAQTQRLGRPWQTALKRLEQIPGGAPSSTAYLRALAGSEDSLWEHYQLSLTRHTRAWQEVLGACKQGPGQEGWPAAPDQARNSGAPDHVAKGAILFGLLDQVVFEESAELGNVPAGGGVGGEHFEQLARGQIANRVMQHHDRLGAHESLGIQLFQQ